MNDTATNSMRHILDSGEYETFDVPCFDVHQEFDTKGKMVRDFTPAALQQIADLNNRRRETGSLGKVGFGHTLPPQMNRDGVIVRAKETDQPAPLGFISEFKVAPFGPAQKIGLLVKLYMKKRIQLPDGRILTAQEALAEFPSRSIELWQNGLIDWLALLRVTPERDLGMTTAAAAHYQRDLLRYAPWQALKSKLYLDPRCGRIARAAYDLDGKLRYSMEATMPMNDPTAQPDANANPEAPTHDLSPEEMGHADRVAAYFKSGQCKHYAANEGPGMPGASNTYIPGAVGAKRPNQFARPGAPAPQAALDEAGALRAELDKERRLRRYEAHLRVLREEDGLELDVAEELAEVDRQNLDDAGFDHFCKRLCRYEKRPDGGRMLPTREQHAAPKEVSRADAVKATNLASRKGIEFEAALAEVRGV